MTEGRDRVANLIEHLKMLIAVSEKIGGRQEVSPIWLQLQEIEAALAKPLAKPIATLLYPIFELALNVCLSMYNLGVSDGHGLASVEPVAKRSRAERKQYYEDRNRQLLSALINDPRWPAAKRKERAKMKSELAEKYSIPLTTLKKALKRAGL